MKKFLLTVFLCASVSVAFSQNEAAVARLKNFTITNIPSQLVFVTKDEVNIREEPNLSAPRMEQNFGLGYYMAYRGVYKCLGSRNGWYNIIIPPTTLDGWVSGTLARRVSNEPIDWNEVRNKAYRMSGGVVRVAKHRETGLVLMEFHIEGESNNGISYTDLYLGKQVSPSLLVFIRSKRISDKQAGYDYAKDAELRSYGESHRVWIRAAATGSGRTSFDLEAIPSSLLLRIMGAPERDIDAELGCELITTDVLTSPIATVAQTTGKSPTLKTDTLKCELYKYDDYLSLRLSLEYPISGPERMVRTLTDTILKDICNARGFIVETISDDEIAHTWNELSGKLWNSLNADWDELEADGMVDEDEMFPYSLDVDLSCAASTANYATFVLTTALFPMGAAHPLPAISLYTVDANTGRLLKPSDIFMDTESEQLEELIYQELCRQYEGAKEEFEAEEMESAVALPDGKAVALMPKGVLIQYQPYELGSYAFGAPACTLPISKVRHMLTPYALQLLGE